MFFNINIIVTKRVKLESLTTTMKYELLYSVTFDWPKNVFG